MAKRLGISRSEPYAKAVRDFVDRLRRTDITERLNEVYADDSRASDLDRRLEAMQTLSLQKEEWLSSAGKSGGPPCRNPQAPDRVPGALF